MTDDLDILLAIEEEVRNMSYENVFELGDEHTFPNMISQTDGLRVEAAVIATGEMIKPRKNGNKMAECLVCRKKMRRDVLRRHTNTHKDLLSLSEEEVKKELRVRHAADVEQTEHAAKRQRIQEIAEEECLTIPPEVRLSTPTDRETLLREMVKDDQEHINKIEHGRMVASILDDGNIREQSLNRENQEALRLFRKQQPRFNISDIQLRSWQQDAMKYFQSPTERKVIWIRGNTGNEGKSWFQNYVQSLFGFERVCRLDLRIKHGNTCNVLKKRALGTIDIFLFNDSRSVSGEDLNLYTILENLKDGDATASKYDNDTIRFKTPNTVMVFSNHHPDLKKLSKDRWILLHPNKDGLKDVLDMYIQNSRSARQRANENFNNNNFFKLNIFFCRRLT